MRKKIFNSSKRFLKKGKSSARRGFKTLKNNKKINTFKNRTKSAFKKTGSSFGNIIKNHGNKFLDIGLNVGERLLSHGMDKLLNKTNDVGNTMGNNFTNMANMIPYQQMPNYQQIPNYFPTNYPQTFPMYGGRIKKKKTKNKKQIKTKIILL